jgi:hypothetical protein
VKNRLHHSAPVRRSSGRVVWLVVASLLWCLLPAWVGAETGVDASKAARIKAAYLRYIAEFTTWPDESIADGETIVLGTTGADPHGVAEILERGIERQALRAQDHPLELRRLPDSNDAGFEAALADCHLLFLSGPETSVGAWERIRTMLADRPVVTVAEIDGFSKAAGMIEFVIDPADSRVTMHIDLAAVHRARLRLSSRLLGLKQGVKIVRTPASTDACRAEACEEIGQRVGAIAMRGDTRGPKP